MAVKGSDELGRRKDAVSHGRDGDVSGEQQLQCPGPAQRQDSAAGQNMKSYQYGYDGNGQVLELVNTDAAGTPRTERGSRSGVESIPGYVKWIFSRGGGVQAMKLPAAGIASPTV
ncbi:hypothetical protein [Paenibacillus graminis]|nr:hypothetical protein [Paenibacillus graminis]